MKQTIKTYKNFEDFNENDYIRTYYADGSQDNGGTFKLFLFNRASILEKFYKNLIEVVSQAPRKKLTKEYLLERKLSEFPLKLYNRDYECNIYNISIRSNDLDISIRSGSFTCNRTLDFLGELYLDPPSKELIEVKTPWAIEEPVKLTVKDVKDESTYEIYLKATREIITASGLTIRAMCSDSATDILREISSSTSNTWIVKFPKSLKEVSGDYSLEELRKLYPNCLYKKTTEGDWLE